MARKYEDADRAILGRAPDAMRCVVKGFRPRLFGELLRRYRYPHPEVADLMVTGAPILGEFAAGGVWSRDTKAGSQDPGLHASERVRQRSVNAIAWPHGHVLNGHYVGDVSSAPVVAEPPSDPPSALVGHALRHHEVVAALALLRVALAVLLSQTIEGAEHHVHVDDLLDASPPKEEADEPPPRAVSSASAFGFY